ncbi:LysR family transcriptional regulator [Bradyrhizobium sp. U87765 SZCCT0131]|uniref:LysR family transcriptional regulator n=1 Tax=unclassified Bradyrhizobium TaxID=2631580 RepID=UPI001BA80C82|nr:MULTISPECIES: LysR family transcriptional regulator [unclassified Bradyrhizobium]MBR1222910.1 LysR family transcriptional regulator [Bradyrhizobium sp. U87765 SZCCT0131]MBR1262646.1 LysR family transcriptional regulator [Bradyrhizobium sp. U87765 SZCCT0134]MBR1308882.1 LysR family transcriptional regulator [Bradyrhizobium sp. U87765 SZCCT0110]MBR1318428.1 LysR family transcriptional regulator [Bradyrhizobium sp. U87765 SZCCT0109]MBR1352132.1 LysR family transcriptional regulator [Bradyrhizo
MDTLVNLQAFLATAESSGFSAAGRKLNVSTSVVAKRVTQLEEQIGTTLFHRSTRQMRLTKAGQQYLHRARSVVADVSDLLARMGEKDHDLADQLRIKAPTSLTIFRLADVFSAFQAQNPQVRLDIVLIDRPVDPVTEGFDIAIGAFPHAFGGVIDEPLCPMRRLLCAAPDYLARHGAPAHPRDLVDHTCLSFLPTGPEWQFDGPRGRVTVQVQPRMSSNEGYVLVKSAIAGNGIAFISRYLVEDALRQGSLCQVLPEYPIPDLWVKATVPERRANAAAVQAMLAALKQALTPTL